MIDFTHIIDFATQLPHPSDLGLVKPSGGLQLVPTSFAPPFVVSPQPQAITAIWRPNTIAFISMKGKSLMTIQLLTEFRLEKLVGM